MKTFIFLIALLLRQQAYSQGDVIELDRKTFCASVDELKFANAELLGAAVGIGMSVDVFARRVEVSATGLREASDLLLSAAKKASDAANPIYDICAQD
ncbi:hypothetical protein [Chromatocurvus halotolerans]|nr:hypothetical protein [Chromatocurvus halotolerans]